MALAGISQALRVVIYAVVLLVAAGGLWVAAARLFA